MTTMTQAKTMIKTFIADRPHLKAAYAAQTDKWLFVEYEVIAPLDLPNRDSLIEFAEDLICQ